MKTDLEGRAMSAYKHSKIAAERVVEGMVRANQLPAVIVNPSAPIGPRDIRPTPTGRIIVEAASVACRTCRYRARSRSCG